MELCYETVDAEVDVVDDVDHLLPLLPAHRPAISNIRLYALTSDSLSIFHLSLILIADTECPNIYRKFVQHLRNYRFTVYLIE